MNELKGKLNGISLFSGYAGIDIALSEYVKTICYCEIEKYAQGILLSRMDEGSIEFAPIWNDVTTLDGKQFKGMVDIIFGGFPCQDISVAGKGAGLEGQRSGLFKEIVRLAREIYPTFLFLENVPAIRTRGGFEVQRELASIGYDTRWTTLSASEIGANHKRERWFCLATNTKRLKLWEQSGWSGRENRENQTLTGNNGEEGSLANSLCEGLEGQWESKRIHQELSTTDSFSNSSIDSDSISERFSEGPGQDVQSEITKTIRQNLDHVCFEGHATSSDWWTVEPDVGRVANGIAFRVDRIKALGNGVVPLQVKTAFETLMGMDK